LFDRQRISVRQRRGTNIGIAGAVDEFCPGAGNANSQGIADPPVLTAPSDGRERLDSRRAARTHATANDEALLALLGDWDCLAAACRRSGGRALHVPRGWSMLSGTAYEAKPATFNHSTRNPCTAADGTISRCATANREPASIRGFSYSVQKSVGDEGLEPPTLSV
jgi:hypothetical protein